MESASRNRQRLVWVLILLIVSRTMPNCVVSMNSTLKTTTTGFNETASVGAVWTDFQCTDFSAHYEKCRSVRNRINLNARVIPVSRNTTAPVSVLAQNYTAMKVGRAFVTYYSPVISVIGIVGNILSLIVSLREHNRKITGSWYIAALAVADLWVVVSALMQWIMGIFFPDNRHPIACKVAMFISDVGNLCGTRLLIAMGYDRYKAISAPLERPRWRTVKVTRYIIGLIFIVDLVGMSHFFWFDFTFDLHMGCSVKEAISWLNMTVYSVCRFAIDSIIPFLLIFGCDMLLLKALKNRYKDLRPLTTAAQESFKQCEDNEPNAISAEEARTGAAERKSRKTAGKTDIQLAVMLVTVSIAFLCLMSPPLIARILVFSIEYRHDPRLFANMSMAIQVTTQAMVTKSCINVFLYLLTGSKFRRDLRALFCKTPVRPAHLKRRNAARRGRGRADANDVGSTTNSVYHVEDVIEKIHYSIEEESPCSLKHHQLIKEERARLNVTGKRGDSHTLEATWSKEDLFKLDLTDLAAADYSLHTRNVVTRLHPERINIDLIVELLKYLDTDATFGAVDGAVLIFMPGLSHIQELYEQLQSDRQFADQKRYRIIPLHSVLTSQDQSQAFDIPPVGCRKIVIATNIAETGITIPDVVFVVDTGKVKENRYVETTQMSVLEEVFVSKASAKQRQGRAGRVREGFCFRLYTKERYNGMKSYSVPEILRVPLEELCLHIMKSNLGNPLDFLSAALDPPNKQNVARAMSILREIEACDRTSTTLTPLGHHLATLPVDVRLGKMLIFGAIFGCLESIAVIAAAISDKSPWAFSLDNREETDLAKASLAEANSDHITLYKVYHGWLNSAEQGKASEMSYCRKWFLKRSTLLDIQNVSRDLVKLVHSIGFVHHGNSNYTGQASSRSTSLSSKNIAILKSVLTAGFYPRIAKVTYTPKVDAAANQTKPVCFAQTRQGSVSVHPASVNRFLGVNGWMLYHEKVKQTNIYIKDTTLISAYPMLLFGGDITVQHREQVISVDDWIQFKAHARTAVIFQELRKLISNLLTEKIGNPEMDIEDDPIVKCLVDLITSEK